MNILVLGDVFGPSGVTAIKENLPKIIKEKKIDFVVTNGENAAEGGVGITKENTDDFFKAGTDVITSGNHIWDEKETMEFITKEKRLLRPQNLIQPSPGEGFGKWILHENSILSVVSRYLKIKSYFVAH